VGHHTSMALSSPVHHSNTIVNIADDTTVVGLISGGGGGGGHRDEVERLAGPTTCS